MVEALMPLRTVRESRLARVLVESAIAVAVFAGAVNWGTWYWNQSLSIGRHPFFYQLYYEPAVMLACGKGFVVAQPQIPKMTAFLQEQTQTFDCSDIPPHAKLGTDGLYQGSARYIMTAVGLAWRFTGVSWRKLGPVAGVLFGLTILAAYGIFRLGMGRVLAVLMSAALSMSTLHLLNLPNIRDYSKAPFALLLIWLLGLLVTRTATWKRVLLIAVAYGAVMGIGYGFRTDLLINVPAFVLVAALFLDAPLRRRLVYAAGASALCFATFYVTAWPVISAVNRTWGCQWHVAVLGLGDDETAALQLKPAAYDWVDGYTDEFVHTTTTSYAARVRSGVKHIEYCGPEYDEVTRAFMLDVAAKTPADFVVRAYASALQMIQLPLRWRRAPMPHVATDYYKLRIALTSRATSLGIVLVAAAICLIAARSIRLGLFAIAFLVYFGGYPAVQFANRHFFHLEFITWFALGFLLQQLVTLLVALVRKRPIPRLGVAEMKQSALVIGGSAAALVAVLWLARWYQESSLEPLMKMYADAQAEPVPLEKTPTGLMRVPPAATTVADPEAADLLEVTLNEWQCPPDSKLTFKYDGTRSGYARDIALKPAEPHMQTEIFLPVYAKFQGVSVGSAPAGCLAGVYRVLHPERFALMPKVTLRPGWEEQPLYQTLDGWGVEPPSDD